jgi:hypothetical protein
LITFHNAAGGARSGIYVMNAGGTGRAKVPNSQHGDFWPTWSRDGEWLAFARTAGTALEYYKVRTDGTGLTRLTISTGANALATNDGPAVWSADGNALVVAGSHNGIPGLYSVPADGSLTPTLHLATPAFPSDFLLGSLLDFPTQTPTVSVQSSSPSAAFGTPLTFTATVTAPLGIPTGEVTFLIDGGAVETVPLVNGRATYTAARFPSGAHTVTASYSGAIGYAFGAGSLSQAVTPTALPAGAKFVHSVGTTVYLSSTDGVEETSFGNGFWPHLSPDGQYVAFRRGNFADPFRADLWVRNLSTGAETFIHHRRSRLDLRQPARRLRLQRRHPPGAPGRRKCPGHRQRPRS